MLHLSEAKRIISCSSLFYNPRSFIFFLNTFFIILLNNQLFGLCAPAAAHRLTNIYQIIVQLISCQSDTFHPELIANDSCADSSSDTHAFKRTCETTSTTGPMKGPMIPKASRLNKLNVSSEHESFSSFLLSFPQYMRILLAIWKFYHKK